MKKLYEGKTKNVYELENGNVLLKFKDDVHYEAAKAAYEAGDYETLLKEAHTLKGVAGTLGLTDIYQTCANIVTAKLGLPL
mgnify:CR=1 FL=1